MTRSHFNDLRLILSSRLFLKYLRKYNLYEQLQSGVRPQQRNSIIKNDLWPADDSWHLFPHYRGSSRSERGLDAISRTILQMRLASITPPPPSLFHHISLRYHTKFMFCFCWGAPGFRSGASFIHCLHASTRSRFRNTVLAFTVTRMTLRCIFFHPSTHLPLWLPHGGHSMVLLPHLPKIISNKPEVLLISTASTPTNSQTFSINVDNSSILLSPQSCQSHINRSLPTSTPSFPHSFLTLNPIVV